MRRSSSWLLAASLLLGCETVTPVKELTIPPLPPPKTVGSLWQEDNGRAYLYEDLRASRIGDIITVIIQESQKGSKSANTAIQRQSTSDNSMSGSATGFPGFNIGHAGAMGMALKGSAANKFNGQGSTARADTLTGTISVVVVEVLPNGDLRIEGQRDVTINSENQKMIVKGIVRRVDVNTKNQVLSTAIAEAQIRYTGFGVVDDVQRPGWWVRLMDWIYPF